MAHQRFTLCLRSVTGRLGAAPGAGRAEPLTAQWSVPDPAAFTVRTIGLTAHILTLSGFSIAGSLYLFLCRLRRWNKDVVQREIDKIGRS